MHKYFCKNSKQLTGYTVLSGYVKAFKNVCNDPLSKCAKGSREGYFLDPHRTESDDETKNNKVVAGQGHK